jgi:hypothetical protein
MGEVASRRIGIVYYQHETLGLFGYSVYFQRWTDVLALTGEAFWDVPALPKSGLLSFIGAFCGIFTLAVLVIRLSAASGLEEEFS